MDRRQALIAAAALPTLAAAGSEPASIEISMLDNVGLGVVALAVLRQAYARLGVTVNTRILPLRRGVQMADAGEIDGDLMHSAVPLMDWPRLIRIRVPIVRAVFAAYRRGAADCPARLERDKLAGLRLAYMRGTRAVETQLPAELLLACNNNLDALRHVQRGITDYAVLGQIETDALIVRHGMHDKICKLAEPVVTAELFHSLNQRHAELAARMERVLGEMQSSGELARLWTREARRAQAAIISGP